MFLLVDMDRGDHDLCKGTKYQISPKGFNPKLFGINWQIRREICKLVQGPLGPLSKFRNRSLLVALSGGVKELRAFPAILHLSGTSSKASKYELSHGTYAFSWGPPHLVDPTELMAFTARGQPEIRQIGRALGRRPAGVRHNSLGLRY